MRQGDIVWVTEAEPKFRDGTYAARITEVYAEDRGEGGEYLVEPLVRGKHRFHTLKRADKVNGTTCRRRDCGKALVDGEFCDDGCRAIEWCYEHGIPVATPEFDEIEKVTNKVADVLWREGIDLTVDGDEVRFWFSERGRVYVLRVEESDGPPGP